VQQVLHATSVALAGRGLLIRGASGAGKSALALEMISRGARLISDDRTIVTREDRALWLDAPEAIRGMIEARGLGLLRTPPAGRTRLAAVVDLDTPEASRLPPPHLTELLGLETVLLHNPASAYFPAGLMTYLRQNTEG
jgi:serine kinase of HPr protein (carbohydrate metabolism regulator)